MPFQTICVHWRKLQQLSIVCGAGKHDRGGVSRSPMEPTTPADRYITYFCHGWHFPPREIPFVLTRIEIYAWILKFAKSSEKGNSLITDAKLTGECSAQSLGGSGRTQREGRLESEAPRRDRATGSVPSSVASWCISISLVSNMSKSYPEARLLHLLWGSECVCRG